MITIRVLPLIYNDSNARNWLTIRQCRLIPTKIGGLEVEFNSESDITEFVLKFSQYVIQDQTKNT